MATVTSGRRPFPALVIVSLLFLLCLYPGQAWVAHFFPRLAGLATIDPGLIIMGSPFRLLFSIDLNLLPLQFFPLYAIILAIYCISRHQPFGRNVLQRFTAVISGVFFLVVCTATGALISYVLVDQLPVPTQNKMAAFGITADIHLPFLGYRTNPLRGDILSLLGFLAGLAILIVKISSNPLSRRPIRLTREQRMTPYQRMLQERRQQSSPSFIPEAHATYAPGNAPSFEHIPVSSNTPSFERLPVSSNAPSFERLPVSGNAPSFEHHPVSADATDYVDTPVLPRKAWLHCCNQPLQSLEPEAVNYRPLG